MLLIKSSHSAFRLKSLKTCYSKLSGAKVHMLTLMFCHLFYNLKHYYATEMCNFCETITFAVNAL